MDIKQSHKSDTILSLQRVLNRADIADQKTIIALIDRISLCNSKQNAWSVDEAINFETGELYIARGRYWNCNSKLCPNCCADASRRARKHLIKRMSEIEFKRGQRLYFPTLTIVNPKQSLAKTREIINHAWTLLRKRKFWCDLIIGGFKAEEFTVTTNGFHYHFHLLLQSKFILYNEFRRVWTECVELSFEKFGIPFVVNNSDKLLSVVFKKVDNADQIPFELCKYITKTDSWSKLKNSELMEIALIRRWHRTREYFGTWKTPRKEDEIASKPIVHKTDLTDGGFTPITDSESWRDRVWLIGNEHYRRELMIEFEKMRNFRRDQILARWKHAKISDNIATS